jgi:SAM-dependent methyltransferase
MPPCWNFDRVDRPELMDAPSFSEEDARGAHKFLAMTNRLFGGAAVVLRFLEAWSAGWDRARPVTILDAGTGGADIPAAVARWARRRGWKVRLTAADLAPATARRNAAAFPEIEVVQADALALTGAWDCVIASLFLHHVPPARNAEALRRLDRLARRGIIVSDLRRSPAAYAAVWALTRMAGDAVARHDGPLSVLRAFTVPELTGLAREAGLPHLRARREPWFRVSLAGVK